MTTQGIPDDLRPAEHRLALLAVDERHVMTTTDPTIVIYMMPPKECSPNARVHWRKRAQAVRMARNQAIMHTRAGLNGESPGLTKYCGHNPGVVIDIEVAWNGRRRQLDADNCIASCKPFLDGVADVLWFGDDSQVRIGEVRQFRGAGTTTLTLRDAA